MLFDAVRRSGDLLGLKWRADRFGTRSWVNRFSDTIGSAKHGSEQKVYAKWVCDNFNILWVRDKGHRPIVRSILRRTTATRPRSLVPSLVGTLNRIASSIQHQTIRREIRSVQIPMFARIKPLHCALCSCIADSTFNKKRRHRFCIGSSQCTQNRKEENRSSESLQ